MDARYKNLETLSTFWLLIGKVVFAHGVFARQSRKFAIASPRQLRQLDYGKKQSTDVRYVIGTNNIAADFF